MRTQSPRENTPTKASTRGKALRPEMEGKVLVLITMAAVAATGHPLQTLYSDGDLSSQTWAEEQHAPEEQQKQPPPPPQQQQPLSMDQLCPDSMPQEWKPACIHADLLYDPNITGGLLPDVANGNIGTVAGSNVVYMHGVFNGDSHAAFGPVSHRALINTHKVTVADPMDINAPGTGRALDMANGLFLERTTTKGGVLIEQTSYAHSLQPSLLISQIQATNPTHQILNLTIDISDPSDSPDLNLSLVHSVPHTNPFPASSTTNTAAPTTTTTTNTTTTTLVHGCNKVPESRTEVDPGNHTCVAIASYLPATTMVLPAGATVTAYIIHAMVSSLTAAHPAATAADDLQAAIADTGSLLPDHVAGWQDRFSRGSISVAGDDALARATNASLFAIRSSIRDDVPYGLSPGGLTSNGYNGHTFWDQETWMWSPLLFLDPPSAKSALQYRYDRRATAGAKAHACGTTNHSYCQRGFQPSEDMLMFPWESAFTGDEVQFSGGKLGHWGMYEQHISGDISLAATQYYHATHDTQWLEEVGYPLVSGIAAFYAARAEADPNQPAKYNINNVMGPDEYAYPVNNSAYTNTVASLSITAAIELAAALNRSAPQQYSKIAAGLSAASGPVPQGLQPSLKGEYHPEYEGYPLLRGAKVKQADTVMLNYPLGLNMPKEVQANDLEWYEPNTPGGPAMTWSMFAIGWIDLGDYSNATSRFRRGFVDNVHPPFNVWTEEHNGGCTPFLTGAGGFLQSLVFGMSGMRLQPNRLTFDPPVPWASGGNAIEHALLGLHYRGNRLSHVVREDYVEYRVDSIDESQSEPLVLVQGGATHRLEVGKTIRVDRAFASVLPLKSLLAHE